MKRTLILIVVIAMMLSLWIPASAENQTMELVEGESKAITVPWNESVYSVVNGVDPLQVLVSETGIIQITKTGTSMSSEGAYISCLIQGIRVGTTSLVFRNRNTGATLAAYNVTVKENSSQTSTQVLCVNQHQTFTITSVDTVALQCDGEYEQHRYSTRGNSINGNSVYETSYELSFPSAGTVNVRFVLGSYVVKQYTIVVKEHEYGEEPTEYTAATCVEKATETYKCKRCGAEKTESVGELGEHQWNPSPTVDKEATCTEKGVQSIHCSVCGAVKEESVEEIPVKDHSWGEPQYIWERISDGFKVTAVWTCTTCEKKEKQETEVKDSSAKEENEKKVYTARFKMGEKEFVTTKEVVDKYRIDVVADENTTVTLSENLVRPGTEVMFTVSSKEGYTLERVLVQDGDGNTYTLGEKDSRFFFTMPETNVSIIAESQKTAIPAEDDSDPKSDTGVPVFEDVKYSSWYGDAVTYVVEKGYMTGTGSNQFSPNGLVTRAMVAQILYAMEGKPSFAGGSEFRDVEKSGWYYDAVNWAANNDLVAGYGEGRFGPTDPVTREQFAAILHKYTKFKKYDSKASGDLSRFKDNARISRWAVESVQWASSNSLISGFEDGTIQPQGTATRAQLAVILRAYDKNIKK